MSTLLIHQRFPYFRISVGVDSFTRLNGFMCSDGAEIVVLLIQLLVRVADVVYKISAKIHKDRCTDSIPGMNDIKQKE